MLTPAYMLRTNHGHKTIRIAIIIITLMVASLGVGSILSVLAAPTNVGYRDFSYSGVSAPTGQKPQSKLWFNDGIWWGSMFNSSATDYHIYRLDWATQTWSDTGTLIDERVRAHMDVLWNGTYLYVASAIAASTANDNSLRVSRYSYNRATKAYSRDIGFPKTVANANVEAIVLEMDTTGLLWVTYTQVNRVYMAHSMPGDDTTWVAPYVLPVTGASNLTIDDISTVVAYDSKIGVMWGNQNEGAYYFASHVDGAPDNQWTVVTAYSGPLLGDDHMNIKSLQADPSGKVFAAVKTSLTGPNDPLIVLLVLRPQGNWTSHVFSRVLDSHTRAIVLLDSQNRMIYMIASSPCCSGGVIYYKQSSMDNISFPEGLGTPVIQSSTDIHINNPTSTKQQLNNSTGLVVLAGDDTSRYYLHNCLTLGPPPPTPEVCTLTFADVPPDNTFYEAIRCLACRGIISGYADGTFRHNNQVTRGQLAKIVSNSAGFSEPPIQQTFEDVLPTNSFYGWIERLTIRGYMTGYNCGGAGEPCVSGKPYFRPFSNATRGQTAKIVNNAVGFTEPPIGQTFEDVLTTHTFYEFIQRLASRNVMGGYECGGVGEPCTTGKPYFRPGNDVTRGQSAKIVANAFFPGCVTLSRP